MTSSTSSEDQSAAPEDRGKSLAAPLIEAWRRATGPVVFVTGAGVSAASGLRTFRGTDPEALWNRDEIARATLAHFRTDPVDHIAWYLDRFTAVDSARPNAAHRALAELEGVAGDLRLITQNIDTLHEQAGSRRMIKVHGTADRFRCGQSAGCPLGEPAGSIPRSEVDVDAFRSAPGPETLPSCPACGEPLRPHVLFFDEYYTSHRDYRFAEVEEWLSVAGIIVFAGTSFSVGVTALALDLGRAGGVPMFSIDPAGERAGESLPVVPLAERAEIVLPAVAAALD